MEKFKNIYPIVKKDAAISDLRIPFIQTNGKQICCSNKYICCSGNNSARLQIFDTKFQGKKDPRSLEINAHREQVNDIGFSNLVDDLLVSSSRDLTVKLWRVPSATTFEHNETIVMDRNAQLVQFHPCCKDQLTVACSNVINMYNLEVKKEFYRHVTGGVNHIQSFDFNPFGRTIVTNSKDKMLRIIDTRDAVSELCCDSHRSVKDVKVVWMGNEHNIFSSGFDSNSSREIILRDIRNIKQRIDCKVFDVAVGVLIPIYNRSNDVLFAAAKGDTSIHHIGIKHNSILIWSKYQGKQQKDVCFARSLLHSNEICHLYQLTSNSIENISYQGNALSDISPQEIETAAQIQIFGGLNENERNGENIISAVDENYTVDQCVVNEKTLKSSASIIPNIRKDVLDISSQVDIAESESNDTNILRNPNVISDISGGAGNISDQFEETEILDIRRSHRLKTKTIIVENIESHMQPKIACSICGDLFSYKRTLQRHKDRRHIIKHNMECVICHKKFKHRNNLKQHIKQQHVLYKKKLKKRKQKTKFFCAICDRKFAKKTSLTRHNIVFHISNKQQ